MARSRMFSVVTETWNPVTGCLHGCVYCWARRFALTRLRHMKKYRGGFYPTVHDSEFGKVFSGGFVFVCDMGDLFGSWVPGEWIERVLGHVRRFPGTTFLFLTKNPSRYLEFLDRVPPNAVLGATIETNRDDLARSVSRAPPPSERLEAMRRVDSRFRKLVSIEPVLDFDLDAVVEWMRELRPWVVYVGYDNYGNRLPEPPLSKVLELVTELRRFTNVVEKTNRSAWYEAVQ